MAMGIRLEEVLWTLKHPVHYYVSLYILVLVVKQDRLMCIHENYSKN